MRRSSGPVSLSSCLPYPFSCHLQRIRSHRVGLVSTDYQPSRTSRPAPAKKGIEMPAPVIHHAEELREIYLMAFDNFGVDPVTVEQETGDRINTRFARELLATLTRRKILTETEAGDGEVIWQVIKPGTADGVDRADAVTFIEEWLGLSKPASAPRKPAKKAASAVSGSKSATTPKAKAEPHDCLCGCGEMITSRSFYRPGHDARHAGQIGREVAAVMEGGHDEGDQIKIDTLYAMLPTEPLRAKAERIADTANQKALKKAKPEAAVTSGTIRIGKNLIAAVMYPDGKVVAADYKKPLSKSAVASFKPLAS